MIYQYCFCFSVFSFHHDIKADFFPFKPQEPGDHYFLHVFFKSDVSTSSMKPDILTLEVAKHEISEKTCFALSEVKKKTLSFELFIYAKFYQVLHTVEPSLFQALGCWEGKKRESERKTEGGLRRGRKRESSPAAPRLSPPSFFPRSFSLVPDYREHGTGKVEPS